MLDWKTQTSLFFTIINLWTKLTPSTSSVTLTSEWNKLQCVSDLHWNCVFSTIHLFAHYLVWWFVLILILSMKTWCDCRFSFQPIRSHISSHLTLNNFNLWLLMKRVRKRNRQPWQNRLAHTIEELRRRSDQTDSARVARSSHFPGVDMRVDLIQKDLS